MKRRTIYILLAAWLVFGLSASLCSAAALEEKVDTDVVGGAGDGSSWANAYNSANAAEAAEQQDLTDNGGDTLTFLCRGGANDTTVLVVNGSITSAANYIKFQADDFPSDGIWDDTKYILDGNDAQHACVIKDDHVRLVNMQILVTVTPNNSWDGVTLSNIAAGSAFFIDSCIIKGVCAGSGASNGLLFSSADITLTVYNTQVYGFISSGGDVGDTGFKGINIGGGVGNIYNCTLYNNRYGIRRSGGTVTAINCAFFGNADDIDGTVTLNNCATDDGDDVPNNGNITITQSADDWAALVVDAAGGDFHLTDNSSELHNAGDGANVKATFTDDTEDNERPGVDGDWDIGAYEYEAVGGGQVIIIQMSMLSPLILFSLFCFIKGRKR